METPDTHDETRRPGPTGRGGLRAAWVGVVLALTGWSLAFDPAVGTELLLADAAGSTLIGYGRIDEGGLRLDLSTASAEMRVVVVRPDGSAESYRGVLRDGRLELEPDGGPAVDVADALALDDRTLTLSLPDAPESVVPSRHAVGPDTADAGDAAAAEEPAAGAEDPSDEASADAPGRSDDAPGRADDADDEAGGPGRSDDAPGRSGDDGAPGRSGDAPGRSGEAPGRSGDAPGRSGDAPGRSGDAPGRSGGAPGNNLLVAPEGDRSADPDPDRDDDVIDLVDLADGWL